MAKLKETLIDWTIGDRALYDVHGEGRQQGNVTGFFSFDGKSYLVCTRETGALDYVQPWRATRITTMH